MKPKQAKRLLSSAISEVARTPQLYCIDPKRDFTRTRKITMKTILEGTINMEGRSLPNELTDMFNNVEDAPTVSAFVQQRDKVKPEAFEAIFNKFTSGIGTNQGEMAILAVDGSDVRLPDNPNDKSTYLPGSRPNCHITVCISMPYMT